MRTVSIIAILLSAVLFSIGVQSNSQANVKDRGVKERNIKDNSAEDSQARFFAEHRFTEHDALLLIDPNGQISYQWRAEQAMLPASLVKLLTAAMAIDKWGLEHKFRTDFLKDGNTLWVKGYADPYLISEELDLIASHLLQLDLQGIKQGIEQGIDELAIDASYFKAQNVPGRSLVDDPYNAPLSAVSANFNTVFLARKNGLLVSAEPQTPLTEVARALVSHSRLGAKPTRVNLLNGHNAQLNFAQILLSKLGLKGIEIKVNQGLPSSAKLIYQHRNSHSLHSVLQGMMEYSNNFIANQLFLCLSDAEPGVKPGVKPGAKPEAKSEIGTPDAIAPGFAESLKVVNRFVGNRFGWHNFMLQEGAGLSRNNRLSAQQIAQLLTLLAPYKSIFKQVRLGHGYIAYAKTGTLNGVSNYAGFIQSGVAGQAYRFVFMFNRPVPYGYRDALLNELATQLAEREKQK